MWLLYTNQPIFILWLLVLATIAIDITQPDAPEHECDSYMYLSSAVSNFTGGGTEGKSPSLYFLSQISPLPYFKYFIKLSFHPVLPSHISFLPRPFFFSFFCLISTLFWPFPPSCLFCSSPSLKAQFIQLVWQ